MVEFLAHNLAPIMFVCVMGMLLLGYPVAFTLAAGGLGFFVIGVALSPYSDSIHLFWPLMRSHPERFFGIMSNDTLLALPYFALMGLILERCGMAEELLETIGQLFGPVRGGLAYAVIFVGALLAATTGIVAASVMAMGLISLPIMLRSGYRRSIATGTVVASGTLTQIVPPSIVLIVMADQLGRSVGDMYNAALVPAGLVIGAYAMFVLSVTLLRPAWLPALPPEARTLHGGTRSLFAVLLIAAACYLVGRHVIFAAMRDEVGIVWSATLAGVACLLLIKADGWVGPRLFSPLAQRVVLVLMPPLALIFLVLGTIFLGIATPTEAGAMGAVGAMALAIAKRRLDLAALRGALEATAILSAFALFILIGARVFGLTFYGIEGNHWIEEALSLIPGDRVGFLVAVTIAVFILGCFLDFFEIAFIVIPLLVPAAVALDIDLVWFGILISLNLMTSFLTPPFGFSLFFLRSVSPPGRYRDPVTNRMVEGIRTSEIYAGVLPFILVNVMVLGLIIAFPDLVLRYKDEVVPVPETDTEVPSLDLGGSDSAGPSFSLD